MFVRASLNEHPLYSIQDVEELYKNSAWKLDKLFGGPAKSYDAFKLAITETPEIWDHVTLEPKLKVTRALA